MTSFSILVVLTIPTYLCYRRDSSSPIYACTNNPGSFPRLLFSQLVLKYEQDSLSHVNVQLKPGGGWELMATRTVQPGQELYMSYGRTYWLKRLLNTSMDSRLRLLLYLYQTMTSPDTVIGDSLAFDREYNLVMAKTGEEPTEEWCQMFGIRVSSSSYYY